MSIRDRPPPKAADASVRIVVLGLGRYSGAGTISLHLTKELSRRAEILAVISNEALNREDWEAASRQSSFGLATKRTYDSMREALLQSLVPIRIGAIVHEIRRFSPDAVLVPMTHLWIYPIMRMLSKPSWVVIIHDPYPHPGTAARLANIMDRAVARKADSVVTHSRKFIDVVSDSFHIPRNRITSIQLGPLSNEARTSTGSQQQAESAPQDNPPDAFVVLCFGRIETYKGIDILLRAAPLIMANRPDITIRIVGRGMDAATRAEAEKCSNVQVDSRWIDDSEISSIFNAVDLVVLPYTSATQSGVIPQSATFSLPVIATDVGGLSEQLDDGRCGVLIAPNNPEALAEAVIRIANDREEAVRLGQALHLEYSQNRSWSAIAEQFIDVIRNAISDPQPKN